MATTPEPVPPVPPANVRLHLADDSVHPADLTYTGCGDDGIHTWTVVSPDLGWPGWPQVCGISADMIPGKTSLVIPVASVED